MIAPTRGSRKRLKSSAVSASSAAPHQADRAAGARRRRCRCGRVCGRLRSADARPSRPRDGDPLPPVVEQVGERLLDRDRGVPSGFGADARRVAEHDRDCRSGAAAPDRSRRGCGPATARAASRAGRRRDRRGRGRCCRAAPAARLSDQQPIGAHGVADVGDVAARVEVADVQDRLAAAGLDLRDLLREARTWRRRATAAVRRD